MTVFFEIAGLVSLVAVLSLLVAVGPARLRHARISTV